MNNQMRFSQEALRKLTAAIEQNASVYLYGATGFGKTSVAERALDRAAAVWISGSDAENHVIQRLEDCNASEYIVLDDLHCLESAMLQRKIVQMVGKEGFRMVMIGRAPLPAWASALTLQAEMVIISEDELMAKMYAACPAVSQTAASSFGTSRGMRSLSRRIPSV